MVRTGLRLSNPLTLSPELWYRFIRPRDERVTDDQHVHLGPQEAIQRLFGLADDRFVFVEVLSTIGTVVISRNFSISR
jgi:hypothetical protein